VRRRYESSIAPGAWESLAAARFRRPGLEPPPTPSSRRAYERITVPVLVVEGAGDKLLPAGWAAEIAGQITGARCAIVEGAGHCPQIEQPEALTALVLESRRRGVGLGGTGGGLLQLPVGLRVWSARADTSLIDAVLATNPKSMWS
jgi:pimeloyl-ACP methyl ester carboxylesterase